MLLRVLVVDDEPVNRMVLEQILIILGCEVWQARGGADALAVLSTERFDLVLLDIHMPGLSGFEVIRALRAAASANRSAVVVAVTADTSKPRNQYLASGFTEYMNKPVEFCAVSALIEDLTGFPGKAVA